MLRSNKLLLIPFIFCLFLFFHTSCKKEEIKRIIKVTTDDVSQITTKSATLNGTIVDIGEGITEHGFCWSTTINPTIELKTKTQLGSKNSKGSFSSDLTNLTPNTTYYVRSYASDGEAVKYGNEKSFKTESQTLALITIGIVSEITDSSAIVTGTLSDLGNGIDSILQHGFCWSTNQNPTIENNKTELGSKSSTAEFSSNLTGLSPGTTYYLKAYATNSVGTAYGNEINFTTSAILPSVTTTSVTDITYNSATSGGDITDDGGASVTARGVCWSTSQNPTISDNYTSDGTGTGSFSSSITGLSPVTTYYIRAYATNSEGTAYGDEVNFTTTTTVPTVTTISASSITENSAESGGNITNDGGATVTARGVCWSTSTSPTIADSKTIDGSGIGAFTSSLSGLSSETTYYIRAYATNSVGTAYGNEVSFNTGQPIIAPTVTTSTVSDITETSATVGGNVTTDGGATVTERGIYYSTSASPETTGTKLQIGSGTGTFSTGLTGLASGTIYYIKAYATNSVSTSYGSEKTFNTSGETGNFTDTRDNHEYLWVPIGEQVWMDENLAYLPQVSSSSSGSDTNPYYYVYGYQGSSVSEAKATSSFATYGVLYNWSAAMAGESSSSFNPSDVQGVCPDGWHLPSDAEWKELEMYLGMSQSEADNTGWRGIDEGGKLKETGTIHWGSPNEGATNESGFTALPGGYRHWSGGNHYLDYGGFWWSSAEFAYTRAYYRQMDYLYSSVYRDHHYKQEGFSIRCVRDD